MNRMVVAACTPKTHEPLFQETLVNAGLNKYLFEMTNIRNQDSWVHKDDPEEATGKAKDLVRMAVAKVALMEPPPGGGGGRSIRRPWLWGAASRGWSRPRASPRKGTRWPWWRRASTSEARPRAL